MADIEIIPLRDRAAVALSLFIVRFVVGVIFVMHGSQLVFGAFGGPGIAEMGRQMGFLGYLVAIGQFFGGCGLVLGFLSRFSAFWLIVIMAGAIEMMHWKNGFFLGLTADKNGYEFCLALIAMLSVVLIAGPGRLTLGRILRLPGVRKYHRPFLVLE